MGWIWELLIPMVVAAALAPAAFVGLSLSGPLAWDGVLSFWLKNIAIAVWKRLDGRIPGAKLHRVRVYELPDLFADYYGEP